ncbi:hypothetical protein COO60DRAFT_1556352, partial [Scenedesmus sp. NREL 46B-D3]
MLKGSHVKRWNTPLEVGMWLMCIPLMLMLWASGGLGRTCVQGQFHVVLNCFCVFVWVVC